MVKIIKKASKKVLPAMGGLKKYIINKASLLETALFFLGHKIIEISDSKNCNTFILKVIADDIKKLAKFKKINSSNFYNLVSEIVYTKYNNN